MGNESCTKCCEYSTNTTNPKSSLTPLLYNCEDIDNDIVFSDESDDEIQISKSTLLLTADFSKTIKFLSKFYSENLNAANNNNTKNLANNVRDLSNNNIIRTSVLKITRNLHTSTLQINNYVIIKFLGRGAYGSVRLVFNIDTGHIYALKSYSKLLLKNRHVIVNNHWSSSFDNIKMEIEILSRLYHVNCIKLHEIIDDPNRDKLYLIMEYLDKGSILEQVDCNNKTKISYNPLSESDAKYFFKQLINGVEYLHNNNIIHRDIKPDNLLLSSSKYTYDEFLQFYSENKFPNEEGEHSILKIIDFSVSSIISPDSDEVYNTAGSILFMAPEMIGSMESDPIHRSSFNTTRKGFSGKATDVWSCGMTLYLFLFGVFPYDTDINDSNVERFYASIVEQPIKFDSDYIEKNHISNDAIDLVSKLLEKNPEKRITINEIKKHKWLENLHS